MFLLVGCSKKKVEDRISLHSCLNITKLLNGNFVYNPELKKPCVVYVEDRIYYFYSDQIVKDIALRFAVAINRPKLKHFYKCFYKNKPKNKELSTEEALLIDRKCRKKLGMVDYY